MKPYIGRLKQGVAAILAAALIILSPGLGAYEAFATVVTTSVSGESTAGATPAKLGSGGVSAPSALSNNALSLSLSPATLSQLPGSHPVVVEHALSVAPVPVVPILPQSAAILSAPNTNAFPEGVRPGDPAGPAAAPATDKSQQTAGPTPLASLQTSQAQVSAVLSHKVSNEGAITAAAMPFEGEAKTGAKDETPVVLDVPLADVPAAAKATTSALGRAAVRAAGGTAAAAALFGIGHAFTHAAIQVPSWTTAFAFLGSAGYYIGNALAFVFAVPQILKTFQDGNNGATPVKRALLGMGASLALGLISAPLAGQLFWGLQNLFGALTIAAPLLIGKVLAHHGVKLSGAGAWAATAATCAALLAVSFGLYAAAATVLPAFLPVLLGKAGLAALKVGIQVVTGAAFLFLFAPDIADILKGRPTKGFTPFLNLMFSAASFGFIAWAMQKAVAAPGGSADRLQFAIYAVQNAVYAVVAWLSYVFSRKNVSSGQAAKS